MDLNLQDIPLPLRMRLLRTWYAELPGGFRVGASTGGSIGGRWLMISILLTCLVGMVLIVAADLRERGTKALSILMILVIGGSISLLMWWLGALVFGKVEVQVEGNNGDIFVGIGRLGWRRRFSVNAASLLSVQKYRTFFGECLLLRAEDEYTFGRLLTCEQMSFIVSILQEKFAKPGET